MTTDEKAIDEATVDETAIDEPTVDEAVPLDYEPRHR